MNEQKQRLKILQVGLGPLGQKVSQFIHAREDMEIIALVDTAPSKTGKTISQLSCGDIDLNELTVQTDIKDVLDQRSPDVVVLTTVSRIDEIAVQLEEILSYGVPVVSSCEELVFPWMSSPRLATRVDKIAKSFDTAVVGTGVNPGFLMDTLPIALTAVCQNVTSVKVTRFQDASFRRLPFQRKIGAGLTVKEFDKKVKSGKFGHVGLRQSMDMMAHRFGWKLDSYEETIKPVIASKPVKTASIIIEKGIVTGLRQLARGYIQAEECIAFDFCAAVGNQEPHDTVEIEGTPSFVSTIKGGVNGDIATCAMLVNAIPAIINARPGLRTMTDLQLVSWSGS